MTKKKKITTSLMMMTSKLMSVPCQFVVVFLGIILIFFPTPNVNSVTSLLMSTQERKMMEGMMMTLMMVGLIMEIRRHVYLLFVFIVLRKRKRARIGRRTIASYNTKEHVT